VIRPAAIVTCVLLTGCPHPGDLRFTTATLPPGNVDAAYRASLETEGGAGPLHFDVTDGDFPAGLELDPDSGELHGTPTEAGVLGFTVRATDSGGAVAEQPLLLRVLANPPPRITTTALRAAVVGRPYSFGLQAVDGKAPFTWSTGSGALLPGLVLETTGLVDGSATGVGTSEVELVATDANAQKASATFPMAAYLPITLAPASLAGAGRVGQPYDVAFRADGGLPPYRYSVAGGTLPDGLAQDAAGHLSGTPADAGTWTWSEQVHDESGQAPSFSYTLIVQ
jgi:hypothetical protein